MKICWLHMSFLKAPFLNLLMLMRLEAGSAQLSAPTVVTAGAGRSVTICCHYDTYYRDHTKYWCKGHNFSSCQVVVRTTKPRRRDRSFITEDKDEGVFIVGMTSLQHNDEGQYWCVISRRLQRDIFTDVYMQIQVTSTMIATNNASTMIATNNASTMIATNNATAIRETNGRIPWWATLRWVLFILMLLCFASTYYFDIVVWLKNKVKKNDNKTRQAQSNC